MTAQILQLTSLVGATLVMLSLGFLYLRAMQRQLDHRVQFLEDENRWLRTELEHVTQLPLVQRKDVDMGALRRSQCERGEHQIDHVDARCTYCGEAFPVTIAPPDFPTAHVVSRGRR